MRESKPVKIELMEQAKAEDEVFVKLRWPSSHGGGSVEFIMHKAWIDENNLKIGSEIMIIFRAVTAEKEIKNEDS